MVLFYGSLDQVYGSLFDDFLSRGFEILDAQKPRNGYAGIQLKTSPRDLIELGANAVLFSGLKRSQEFVFWGVLIEIPVGVLALDTQRTVRGGLLTDRSFLWRFPGYDELVTGMVFDLSHFQDRFLGARVNRSGVAINFQYEFYTSYGAFVACISN